MGALPFLSICAAVGQPTARRTVNIDKLCMFNRVGCRAAGEHQEKDSYAHWFSLAVLLKWCRSVILLQNQLAIPSHFAREPNHEL